MLIETFSVGMLSTNCYLVSCSQTKEAVIIDPGLDSLFETKLITDYIDQAGLKIKYILNTHGHSDHIRGDSILQKKYNVPICIHPQDAYFLADIDTQGQPAHILLEENSLIKFGDETLKVLHTPGHTPGSICLLNEQVAFTGDTLFAGTIGRTDFPEGSHSDMMRSLHKIDALPDSLQVYPGHGETSKIGNEKRVNPFLNH
ncbi:MBL fold metallo-hydrolase [Candidatus Bathycorpusculum sp.]|jgi:glyoxylase-like metal-dependent hydrolase (beta-lactamase superfamily II)|uniref:MBL fold metallo-hydrolase n=1 Tax=Candidatus Bathycorpusculum sp. TaxID=2994959 RepID=UPI00281CA0DC|nr:MBL fold metallo-hydrolase [Candidatus Termitimicrobium sp.]MCL2685037.1 MBL fold metallo-hydrolase [Candidatus Termitimicrobium sp.]